MNELIILLLVFVNFAISWYNAWAVGRTWAVTRKLGGIAHFLNWMGAVMSACGFSWVYMVIFGLIAIATGHLNKDSVNAFFSLGYLILIFPILVSGMAITIHSWIEAYKRNTIGSMGVAAWNTFVQAVNVANAFKNVPDAFGDVGDFFGRENKNGNAGIVVVLLVILALGGGVITTVLIIRNTARRHKCSLYETI